MERNHSHVICGEEVTSIKHSEGLAKTITIEVPEMNIRCYMEVGAFSNVFEGVSHKDYQRYLYPQLLADYINKMMYLYIKPQKSENQMPFSIDPSNRNIIFDSGKYLLLDAIGVIENDEVVCKDRGILGIANHKQQDQVVDFLNNLYLSIWAQQRN